LLSVVSATVTWARSKDYTDTDTACVTTEMDLATWECGLTTCLRATVI
jgi:hypothetical protein